MEFPERNAVIAASMALAAGPDLDLSPPVLLTQLEKLANTANPFPAEIGAECAAMKARAAEMAVETHEQAEAMGQLVIEAATLSKTIDARRKGFTVFFDNAKSTVMGWVKPYVSDLDDTVAIGKRKLAAYQDEVRRKAAEAQRELERKAAEERRRIAEETAAREAKAQEERKRLEAQAEAARQAGDHTKAAVLEVRAERKEEAAAERVEELQQQEAMTSAPVVRAAPAKVAGISGRAKWVVQVTDKAALVQHISTRPELLELLQVDQGALNRMANLFKAGFSMPGCTAKEETVIAARGAK